MSHDTITPNGAISLLPLSQWKELVEQKEAEPDWVEGLISQGTQPALLVGPPGVGKTMLALNLAFALATGSDFLGFQCTQARVGFLLFEGAPKKVLDRVTKIGANYPDPGSNLRIALPSPFKLASKIPDLTKALSGCQVVFFDPLRCLVLGDYCKPADAADFINVLDELSARLRFTPIICHHIRKPNKDSVLRVMDIFDIKGAGDYGEVAGTVLMLERKRQEHGADGRYDKADKNILSLTFAKVRDAIGDFSPLSLVFDRERLIFSRLETVKTVKTASR